MIRAVVSWSSGKDSVMAFEAVRGGFDVVGLLTTVTDAYSRVSMHGVRETLVEQQARSIGVPLYKTYIPPNCSNEVYQERMKTTCLKLLEDGVEAVVFGDIFLEDVRRYREENLKAVGMKGVFPLWGVPTHELAKKFIAKGYRAKVVVVDLEKLPEKFAGREFDESFLEDLPESVDPCGENGEFHTFVYDGPVFRHPVKLRVGETVVRDGRFCFVDLLPDA